MSAGQLALWALCFLIAAAFASAALGLAMWVWSRQPAPRTPPKASAFACGGVHHGHLWLVGENPSSQPAPRQLRVAPKVITPTEAEMLALRFSAQFAAEQQQRTGLSTTNPYPPGSRKAIVWATYYLDAQMTGAQA